MRAGMYKNLSFLFLGLFLLGGCERDNGRLPKDLYDQGRPIHPYCVYALSAGDSSRYQPKPVQCFEKRVKSTHFKVDKKQALVREIVEQPDGEKLDIQYRYIGTYENKNLLLVNWFSDHGTGRFSALFLVERKNDTLLNKGEIAAGDRALGGLIKDITLKGSHLSYTQNFGPRDFIQTEVPELRPKYDSSATDYGFNDMLLYEVDLAKPESQRDGVSFYQPAMQELRLSPETKNQTLNGGDSFDLCFSEKRMVYLYKGQDVLNVHEMKQFAHSVAECILSS